MGDVFKEQLVKRKPTFRDTVLKVCLGILAAIIGLSSFVFLGHFGMLVVFGLVFGVKYLVGFLNVEYEYIFTNGELDIDIIYDQSRRKRVFTAQAKQFEIMAHIDDKNHEGTFNSAQETRDYSGGVPGPDTYVFLTVHEGKKLKVIIEPNEKMLKAFSGSLTRRNLHLRPGVVLL